MNRLFDSTGDKALKSANRLKLDIWREDDGNVYAEFEVHGCIGSWGGRDDDDDDGGLKERADLSLVRELLQRFSG